MKSLLTGFSLILACFANAQSPEDTAIRASVNQLFTAMRTGDTTLLAASFAPDAVLQTIATKKDGTIQVRTESIQNFITSIGKPHNEPYDEQIVFKDIKVDAHLASVWTPYKFYVGQKFSHCGVNSFQLVKLPSGWKIQYIIDTRRKESCE